MPEWPEAKANTIPSNALVSGESKHSARADSTRAAARLFGSLRTAASAYRLVPSCSRLHDVCEHRATLHRDKKLFECRLGYLLVRVQASIANSVVHPPFIQVWRRNDE